MSITLALAGDTMLGRGVADRLERTADPAAYFDDGVRAALAGADLVLLNLECCISTRGSRWEPRRKAFHFRAPPQAARMLAGIGVDCVTLANNHALDYGPEALIDTREHLTAAGVHAVGAGSCLAEAAEPVVLTAGGLSVAVLGVTDHPPDFAAARDRPGVAYVPLAEGVPGGLVDAVGALRDRADLVLVLVHWGPNMTTEPLPYVRRAAESVRAAGASLVAGHSAHVFHGVEGAVLYDLGDFIDDYMVDPELRNDLGLIFLVTVDERGPALLEAIPIALDFCRTRLAGPEESAWIRDRFTTACARFGTDVRTRAGHLTADLR
ncbi:poly-gamma-glutamate synthesis protein (capsule biosynthesis protein) [Thermocatellispora tengchongensis]|uniref:Poly-gamma-glutamate synthesis protein (Capsule biosynthesis protein) n=1 Tax=Thermocatellispora tengchongensis TaxID=1073253 RepID=A0A840P4N1_9ACTN|nr:CapA family protein [Thermocatellispora tengchongensis]MBB5133466.1 poly-gamma-glutamate synthesis protein (capsule biosynthesis protein) [Thermocatellispora tengchongensis]